MNPEDGVLDEIDALVNEQLKQEKSGYDHDINQPRCSFCSRTWHGLALIKYPERGGIATAPFEQIEDMDTIVCPGSGHTTQQLMDSCQDRTDYENEDALLRHYETIYTSTESISRWHQTSDS